MKYADMLGKKAVSKHWPVLRQQGSEGFLSRWWAEEDQKAAGELYYKAELEVAVGASKLGLHEAPKAASRKFGTRGTSEDAFAPFKPGAFATWPSHMRLAWRARTPRCPVN